MSNNLNKIKQSKYLAVSTISGIFNNIGSLIITFACIPVIINNIGLELYGAWSITFVFLGLSAFASLGLDKPLIIALSNNKKNKGSYIGIIITIQILASLVFFLILLFVNILELPVFGTEVNPTTYLYISLLLSGFVIFVFQLFSTTLKAILKQI